jgi:hypothetical protein
MYKVYADLTDTIRAIFYTFVAALGIVCFITAFLDIGMNGARYAGWAPGGLGIATICVLIAWLGGY